MPAKFKQDEKRVDRVSKKVTVIKHYMKTTPLQVLMDYINNPNGKPKVKQKCRNEVVKRGYKIVKEYEKAI